MSDRCLPVWLLPSCLIVSVLVVFEHCLPNYLGFGLCFHKLYSQSQFDPWTRIYHGHHQDKALKMNAWDFSNSVALQQGVQITGKTWTLISCDSTSWPYTTSEPSSSMWKYPEIRFYSWMKHLETLNISGEWLQIIVARTEPQLKYYLPVGFMLFQLHYLTNYLVL